MTDLPILNCVSFPQGFPIWERLALEEAILRTDHQNWFLWHHGSPDCIVMGISNLLEELVDFSAYQTFPLPILRRFSGGGTVLVDASTLFASWILSSSLFPLVLPQPLSILQWIGTLVAPIGILVEEQDLVCGLHKVGGNAQYIRKERWLHHTSFLWDYDAEKMSLLRSPKKQPLYRKNRSHEGFLHRLCDHLDAPEKLLHTLLERLQEQFILQWIDADQIRPILEKEHRRSLSWIQIPLSISTGKDL